MISVANFHTEEYFELCLFNFLRKLFILPWIWDFFDELLDSNSDMYRDLQKFFLYIFNVHSRSWDVYYHDFSNFQGLYYDESKRTLHDL